MFSVLGHHEQHGQPNIPCSGQTSIRSSDDHMLVSSGEWSAFSYGLRGQPPKVDSSGQGASLPPQGRKRSNVYLKCLYRD